MILKIHNHKQKQLPYILFYLSTFQDSLANQKRMESGVNSFIIYVKDQLSQKLKLLGGCTRMVLYFLHAPSRKSMDNA